MHISEIKITNELICSQFKTIGGMPMSIQIEMKIQFKYSITFLAIFPLLSLALLTGCSQARPPGTTDETREPQDEVVTVEPANEGPVVFETEINAGIGGKEFSFEGIQFTHIAIGSDEINQWLVKVGVTVNDEHVGFLFAEGWEDVVEEPLRIGPGDTSVWAPIRGEWRSDIPNLMHLRFAHSDMKGLEIPARSFKGVLYLKNDPAALEFDVG